MNELTIFKSDQFGTVRTVSIDNEPWFVAADVCKALDLNNSRMATDRLDDDEKGVISTDTLGGKQNVTVINEPGLYSLVLGSRKPEAKAFKRWITHEVVPAIRKHGVYAMDELLANPDLAIAAFQALKEERDKNRILAEKNAEQTKQIEAAAPKVIFADAVSASQTSILIGELAKLLKQNGVDIGQNKLFERLRNEGYLMKQGSSRNMPTQSAMEKGLFEIKESTRAEPNGSIRIMKTTKVTGKGQQYFINLYLKHPGTKEV